eukprot:CAMPEP_0181419298 /NCGR_PEP_ID=MMETSP1110-20121109/12001_1 /TAXON_ID=174948 /ORGANISM="Symbiodinium sp., Strain CCMP421" /LENGTH=59 /DNA_ID=CAMNT_0023542309 /DNA_START=20 /DNA_END=199 /DNA_ORIENTATION=-
MFAACMFCMVALPLPLPFMSGGRCFGFDGAENLPMRVVSLRIAASATPATDCSASAFFS